MRELEFLIDGERRTNPDACHYNLRPDDAPDCGKPGAYWYPTQRGVGVLCEEHGAKHFPIAAQRITDTTWHLYAGEGSKVRKA